MYAILKIFAEMPDKIDGMQDRNFFATML